MMDHKVYFFTDVHGQLDLFQTMRNWCFKQDSDATIIYGGDACDRGPFGYDIMEMLLDDDRIIYLAGNHEDLFVKAARAIMNEHPELVNTRTTRQMAEDTLNSMLDDGDVYLHIANGGAITLMDWMLEGTSKDFVDRIADLQIGATYDDFDFCHAGASPKAFNAVLEAQNKGEEADQYDRKMLIWDRNSLATGWAPGRTCVFGHTPTVTLPVSLYGSRDKSEANAHPASWQGVITHDGRFTGKKVDMDTGMTWTGRGYVLDVQEMQAIGFFDRKVPLGLKNNEPVQEAFEILKI